MREREKEKEVEFEDLDMNADEVRDVLYDHFPSLKEGGGFQFFKCAPNSRLLQQLSSTTLSSPSMLKSRVGNARTYILFSETLSCLLYLSYLVG